MKPRKRFLLAMNVLLALSLALMMSALFSREVVHADNALISCDEDINVTVDSSTGQVTGTATLSHCHSATQQSITHGTVVITGSSTGTPDNLTISDTDQITWLDDTTTTVATSTSVLTRKISGPANNMSEKGGGVTPSGLFVGSQTILRGAAQRTLVGDNWVYTNQIAYADFP